MCDHVEKFSDRMGVGVELGYSALTRRDRLERIATAERDRRAGRIDMAVATLGEPTEWPARAVLALARLPEDEGDATRRVLESGLDAWAEELGLPALSAEPAIAVGDDLSFDALDAPTLSDVQDELDRPIDASELDQAFAQAETQVEDMLDVNDVAQRVLLDEPLGLAELSEEGDGEILGDPIEHGEALSTPIFFEPPASDSVSGVVSSAVDAAVAPAQFEVSPQDLMGPAISKADASSNGRPSDAIVLATLEGWLHNLTKGTRRNAR